MNVIVNDIEVGNNKKNGFIVVIQMSLYLSVLTKAMLEFGMVLSSIPIPTMLKLKKLSEEALKNNTIKNVEFSDQINCQLLNFLYL